MSFFRYFFNTKNEIYDKGGVLKKTIVDLVDSNLDRIVLEDELDKDTIQEILDEIGSDVKIEVDKEVVLKKNLIKQIEDSKNVKVEFISRNPGMKFADPIKNVTLSKAAPLEIPLDISECKDVMTEINKLTASNGRYYIGFDGAEASHALSAYRVKGKLYIYDQQINGSYDLLKLLKENGATSFEVLRLDNLLFDTAFIDRWITTP